MDFSKMEFSEFSNLTAVCSQWNEMSIEDLKRRYPLAIPYVDTLNDELVDYILANTDEIIGKLK
jgi:hypothetical protein